MWLPLTLITTCMLLCMCFHCAWYLVLTMAGVFQRNMRVSAVYLLFSLLLTCTSAGLLSSLRAKHAYQTSNPVLCTSLPLPSLDPDTMLNKLQLHLDQVDQKVQNALKKDNSSGGAVLSVVYRNMTIWTKGYGLINMSG